MGGGGGEKEKEGKDGRKRKGGENVCETERENKSGLKGNKRA